MIGEVQLHDCPKTIRAEAENILAMFKDEALHSDYVTMTELDRLVCIRYWQEYDAMPPEFAKWYIEKATFPEKIRRARQWLVENGFIIPKPEVEENAREAGNNWKRAIKTY